MVDDTEGASDALHARDDVAGRKIVRQPGETYESLRARVRVPGRDHAQIQPDPVTLIWLTGWLEEWVCDTKQFPERSYTYQSLAERLTRLARDACKVG
jgi:hypothetical protein